MNRYCANCRCNLDLIEATGDSALYRPGEKDEIELCEPCFFLEDDAIEEAGTNNLPERLKHYQRSR